jgi:hypothetical protein
LPGLRAPVASGGPEMQTGGTSRVLAPASARRAGGWVSARVRQSCSAISAGGSLRRDDFNKMPGLAKGGRVDRKSALSWGFAVERVTGIEPALSAWEAVPSEPVMWPDLRRGLSVSDRERPLVTGVNGPLMARQPGMSL